MMRSAFMDLPSAQNYFLALPVVGIHRLQSCPQIVLSVFIYYYPFGLSYTCTVFQIQFFFKTAL